MKRLGLILVVLLLAACGSAAPQPKTVTPKLPRALASGWRAQADAVAAALQSGDGCTAQAKAVALRTSVIAAVNAHRVSPRFQETLLAAVNDLSSRITCTPPPAPAPTPAPKPKPHDHPEPPKHGRHGKHGEGD